MVLLYTSFALGGRSTHTYRGIKMLNTILIYIISVFFLAHFSRRVRLDGSVRFVASRWVPILADFQELRKKTK